MFRFAPNLHFMYQEHSFFDRFAAARADGFTSVEICFAYDVGVGEVARALEDAKQSLVSFNFPAGELVLGEKRGIAGLPGYEADHRIQIEEGIEWAHKLGCTQGIAPLAGIVPSGGDRDLHIQIYIENMKRVTPLLEAAGVTALVEPNNSVEHTNYCLTHLSQARSIVEAVASPNVKMLFDTYHTQSGRNFYKTVNGDKNLNDVNVEELSCRMM